MSDVFLGSVSALLMCPAFVMKRNANVEIIRWCSSEDSRSKVENDPELHQKKREYRTSDGNSYDWYKQQDLPRIRQPGGSPLPSKGYKRAQPDSAEHSSGFQQAKGKRRRKATDRDVAGEQPQQCRPQDDEGSAQPLSSQARRAKLKSPRRSDILRRQNIEALSSKDSRGQFSHDSNTSTLPDQGQIETEDMQATIQASLSKDCISVQPEAIPEVESGDEVRLPLPSPLSTDDTSKVVSLNENGDEMVSGTSATLEKTIPPCTTKDPIEDQNGMLSPTSSSHAGDSTSDEWESCSDGHSSSSQSSVCIPSAVEDYFDKIETNISKWCIKTEKAGNLAGELAKKTKKEKPTEAKRYLSSSQNLSAYRAKLSRRRELLATNPLAWGPNDAKLMETRPVASLPPPNIGYELRAKVHIDVS